MPIYEYKCKACEKEFSFFIYRSDEVAKCPRCESEDLEKLMSCSNAIFSGNGFHKTDYNKEGRKNESK